MKTTRLVVFCGVISCVTGMIVLGQVHEAVAAGKWGKAISDFRKEATARAKAPFDKDWWLSPIPEIRTWQETKFRNGNGSKMEEIRAQAYDPAVGASTKLLNTALVTLGGPAGAFASGAITGTKMYWQFMTSNTRWEAAKAVGLPVGEIMESVIDPTGLAKEGSGLMKVFNWGSAATKLSTNHDPGPLDPELWQLDPKIAALVASRERRRRLKKRISRTMDGDRVGIKKDYREWMARLIAARRLELKEQEAVEALAEKLEKKARKEDVIRKLAEKLKKQAQEKAAIDKLANRLQAQKEKGERIARQREETRRPSREQHREDSPSVDSDCERCLNMARTATQSMMPLISRAQDCVKGLSTPCCIEVSKALAQRFGIAVDFCMSRFR